MAATTATPNEKASTTVADLQRRWPDVDRRDLEVLLTERLETTRASLLAHPEREVSTSAERLISEQVDRLANGEPLAYVLGYRDFYDLRLAVTPAVLIPRPETELLVELALERVAPGASVLDLGTGSGAIAIALARRFDVTATDRSGDALRVARANAERCGQTIDFRQGDWFDAVDGEFDAIVSNPPYVDPSHPALADLTFEPQSALVADEAGLADLRSIIRGAPAHLAPNGLLLLEHGFDQGSTLRSELMRAAWVDVETHRDLAGIERVTVAKRPLS